jgi:hypothetical protein
MVALVVTVVLGLLLAACVPTAGPAAQTGEAAGAAADTGEKVTIRWWHIWPEDTAAGAHWQKMADQYMAETVAWPKTTWRTMSPTPVGSPSR